MNRSPRPRTRPRTRLSGAALLLIALSSATRADDTRETARIRSLFQSAENPEDAETVIRDAFGDGATSALRTLETLKEADLIAHVDARREDAPALRDRILLEVAKRLERSGTKTALPLVRDLAAAEPLVFAYVPGCRRSVRVPVFDHAYHARRAEFSILRRAYETEFASLGPEARVEWLARAGASPGDAPRLAAALRLTREQPVEVRRQLRERLAGAEGALSDATGQLLVEAILADRVVPAATVLRRLTLPAAQRLVLEAARQEDVNYRLATLDLARSHPGVASLAAHLDAERGRASPRSYLERDGASAAAVLARDRSPSMTQTLAAVLSDTAATGAVRRHAALALLHQETPEARAALAAALLSADLPTILARKLRSALSP